MIKKVVVGLGNPGDKYKTTRHNTGFIILDEWAVSLNIAWQNEKKFECELTEYNNFLFVKPTTFMNRVGFSISPILSYYKIQPKDLYVIHDDVDIAEFTYKIQFGRSSAGHRGVEDIILKLKTDEYWRVRIGVGRPNVNEFELDEWVLSKFSQDEIDLLKKLAPEIKEKILEN